MKKKKQFCQSCGMPICKDPNEGGTNTDGSKNQTFCSYCYKDGRFTYKGNLKGFQEHCRQKMIEGGHTRFIAGLYTRGIRRLDRWNIN